MQSELSSMSTNDLNDLLKVTLKFLAYKQYELTVFNRIDEEISKRVKELSLDDFAGVMTTIAEHNDGRKVNEEAHMDLILFEGEDYIEKNLTFFNKDQLLSVIAGYATTGELNHMKELQMKFEEEIKQRMSTFSSEDVTLLVKLFAQSGSASGEFYRLMDKFIGLNLQNIES